MKKSSCFVLAAALFLVLAASASAQVGKTAPEAGNTAIETFTARAFSIQTGQTGVVEVVVNRWSTDAEREALKGVLKAAGSQAMVSQMQNMPQVGYIKTPTSMGDALLYARSTQMPDGSRQVVVATNRPISVAATLAPGAANKYDLSVVEMRFKKGDSKGEGKIVVAGEASIDPKTGNVQLKNFQGAPPVLRDIVSKTP